MLACTSFEQSTQFSFLCYAFLGWNNIDCSMVKPQRISTYFFLLIYTNILLLHAWKIKVYLKLRRQCLILFSDYHQMLVESSVISSQLF
jgi:hypothetical protein